MSIPGRPPRRRGYNPPGHIFVTDRDVTPVAQRPRCKYCRKPLKPFVIPVWTETTDSEGTVIHTKTERDNGRFGYLQQGAFCGPKCGYNYGMQSLMLPGRIA